MNPYDTHWLECDRCGCETTERDDNMLCVACQDADLLSDAAWDRQFEADEAGVVRAEIVGINMEAMS